MSDPWRGPASLQHEEYAYVLPQEPCYVERSRIPEGTIQDDLRPLRVKRA